MPPLSPIPDPSPGIVPTERPLQADASLQGVFTAMLDELTRELDEDVILQQALRAIIRLGRWQSIGLSLLCADGRHWQTRAEGRLDPGQVGVAHPLETGVVGRAYRTGQVQLVPDVHVDQDFFFPEGVATITSELVVPISFDGQVIGALNLESDQPNAFGPVDLDFAQAIARILAIALKNAQRFNALREENAERQWVEQALRSVLLNLETAEAQAGLGSWSFDVRTGKGWWSRQMYSLLQCDPAAGIPDGPSYLELIHPEDRALISDTLAQMAQGLLPAQREFRTNPALGPVRTLSPNYRVQRDGDGALTAYFGTTLDITERKYAEEEMRWARDLFTRLFHSSPIATVFTRMPEATIIDMNAAGEALLGFSREVLVGQHATELMVFAEPTTLTQIRAILEQQGRVSGITCRLLTKDGEPRDCDIYIEPLSIHGHVYTLTQVVDVSERTRSEAALRASEEQYRSLMESLDSAVLTVDTAGAIRYANDRAARQLGETPHALVDKTLYELLPWPVAHTQMGPIRVAIDEDRGITHEALTLVLGEPRWQRITIRPLHDEAGSVIGALINATDIHDLKTAQQQLLELNRTLEQRVRERTAEVQDLYEHAPTGYHSLDADGNLIRINQTQLSWLGYTRDELLGRPFSAVLTPASRIVFDTHYPGFKERGWVRDLEFELVRKDGSTFPVLISATAIYGEDGRFVMSRSTLLDVSGRKRAEEALRESQARLQHFLDTASDLILSVDITGAIDYVNTAWCTTLGYTTEEARAMNICDLVAPAFLEHGRAALGELLTGRAAHQIEIALLTRGGATVVIEGSATVWKGRAGQPIITGLFRDVTRQRQAEEALRLANAELERALRTKDEFLATMSHELRTPLNAILALSEVLHEGLRGPLNERQRESLGNIEASGQHLLALINDVLDLSKVEAGRLDLLLERVSVAEVSRASMQFVKELASKKQVQLSIGVDDELAYCEADPRRLKQMLVNLLSNAVKFTPAGGTVSLKVATAQEAGQVRFSVSDTGIGIAPDELPRLFQPFTQLDARLSRSHEGTGLGLVLVRRLAELHGGSVAVTSEVGRGSHFTITLPNRPAQASAPAPVARPEAPRPLRSALVVDDAASAVEQLTRYLYDLGAVIVTHVEAQGAVAMARDLQPELVVLDLLMPDQSGWEILAALRAEPRTRATPVLIVTVVDEQARGRTAGAAGYLVKPVTQQQLRHAVEAIGFTTETAGGTRTARTRAGLRVLLAEDNAINLEVVRDFLEVKGHTVATARDGRAALASALADPPDVILMDIQMPELDGLEAIKRLRASAACATTPIIALTALAMPGDRERCLAAGADAYLTKPVRLAELAALIAQLTGG